MSLRIIFGPDDKFGYFGYDEDGVYSRENDLPDEISIIMERSGGVNIDVMKTKIAAYISQGIMEGRFITKSGCVNIHPDTIYIKELNSLDAYNERDVDFKIRPIKYKVIFPNSTTPAIRIKALCEDELIRNLPENYHITRIDKVGVGKFVAHAHNSVIENAESLATLVHTGKTNRYVAHSINNFLTKENTPLDNGIFYKDNGKGQKSRRKGVKKSRRKGIKKSRKL